MTITTGRTFMSGDDEAIELPPDMAFGVDVELTLVRSGDVLTVYPTRSSLAALIDRLAALPRPASIEVRDDDSA